MTRRKSEKPLDGDMLPIRNSTEEFLTFVRDNGADTIAVRYAGIIEIVGEGGVG